MAGGKPERRLVGRSMLGSRCGEHEGAESRTRAAELLWPEIVISHVGDHEHHPGEDGDFKFFMEQ